MKHYIEPFFGSGAVLLARPNYDPTRHVETICDADAFIANVWRSLQFSPDEVAKHCDWPVNHCDLMARKLRLIREEGYLVENLTKDDKWHDPELAGYWIWAASCWIGSGLTRIGQMPDCADEGQGVHRIGSIPFLAGDGKGVHKIGQRHLSVNSDNRGVQDPYNDNIYKWFRRLSERLRYVRVVCGDWTRVCSGNWQDLGGEVGIFFDPPYSVEDRNQAIYYKESITVAQEVADWCIERGKRKEYRIVLAGYYEEHERLLNHGWTVKRWKANGGYANTSKNSTQGKKNRFREALFFSPYCNIRQQDLF